MAEFIKEWGPAIVAAVVFIALIAIVQSDAVSDALQTGLTNLITNFSNSAKFNAAAGGAS